MACSIFVKDEFSSVTGWGLKLLYILVVLDVDNMSSFCTVELNMFTPVVWIEAEPS